MKKLIVSLAIASAALIATAPASAQGYWRGGNVHQQLQRMEVRIDRSFRLGSLTRGEARRLHRETNGIQRLAWRYGRNGLTGWEHRDLERRIDRLQYQLQRERHDGDRRGWRY
jgi:hypothetical protein